MNNKQIDKFLRLSNIISAENDIYSIIAEVKEFVPHLKTFNIYFYDKSAQRLKDVVNEFSPIEDILDTLSVNSLYDKLSKLKSCDSLLNDCPINIDTLNSNEDILFEKITIPLKNKCGLVGMLEISLEEKYMYNVSNLKIFFVLASQMYLWSQNKLLSDKLQINSNFYDALKNIAKIIETQYDLNYIIPLIGEMIDKFVSNHLIYVFLKHGSEFELFWPNACRDKKIYELINQVKKDNYVISENKKIGVFPLADSKEVLGCIVAHSTIDKLSEKEISYINQLSKQSSVTIERANVYAEVLKHATLDALTGLNNRRQFEIRLKQEYASAIRQKNPLCAIMLDIDFFKRINDTYGHSMGDKVLKTVSNVIKQQLREYDIPSRYGGEEFCILLPQTKIEEANIVAHRLRLAIEKTIIDENQQIKVTISVGLTQLREGDTAEDLYKRADKALYDAKERGRNRVIVYYD